MKLTSKPIPKSSKKNARSTTLRIIVEKHRDGYIAYPIGLRGVVVGQGDSYADAMTDVTSAIAFHIETFGREVLTGNQQAVDVFLGEARVAV